MQDDGIQTPKSQNYISSYLQAFKALTDALLSEIKKCPYFLI